MFGKHIFLVFKLNKKLLIAIIALIVLLILTSVIMSRNATSVFNPSNKTIVIDPGHGGIDGGSTSGGILEKDVNLAISLKLNTILKDKGMNVAMTRDTDMSLESKSTLESSRYKKDLHARKTIIENNNASSFVCIHMDSYKDSKARGVKIFYYESSAESKALAESICNNINEMVFNNFLKDSTIKAEILAGDYYLLRTIKSPGVIVETGFITNPIDNKLIQQEDYQEIMASAIAEGLQSYLLKNN